MFGADGGPWNGWKTRYCMNGCAAGQLYTGVLLPPGSPEVRCVRFRAHYVPSKMLVQRRGAEPGAAGKTDAPARPPATRADLVGPIRPDLGPGTPPARSGALSATPKSDGLACPNRDLSRRAELEPAGSPELDPRRTDLEPFLAPIRDLNLAIRGAENGAPRSRRILKPEKVPVLRAKPDLQRRFSRHFPKIAFLRPFRDLNGPRKWVRRSRGRSDTTRSSIKEVPIRSFVLVGPRLWMGTEYDWKRGSLCGAERKNGKRYGTPDRLAGGRAQEILPAARARLGFPAAVFGTSDRGI